MSSETVSDQLLGVPGHGITVGVDGQGALVTPAGRLDWSIGAEDRWHHAGEEAAVRQSVTGDGAVVQTRMRIPGGDAVQTTWATVASGRPVVVMEFENASPVPVALAVSGREVTVTARREPSPVAETGADGPPTGSKLWPLPHRTTMRVAVSGPGGGVGPGEVEALPDATAVTSGWATHLDALARVDVDGLGLADGWRDAARILVLAADGPYGGVVPLRVGSDIADVAVALAALGLGEAAMSLLDGVLDSQRRDGRFRRVDPPGDRAALALAAARVALTAGMGAPDWFIRHAEVSARAVDRAAPDEPAAADAAAATLAALGRCGLTAAAEHLARRIAGRCAATVAPSGSTHPVARAARVVNDTARALVREDGDILELAPDVATHRPGVSIEVHDLRTGLGTVSYATRWHGADPALLWELDPIGPVEVRCGLAPRWLTTEPRGETMLTAAPVTGDRSE